MSRIGNSKYPYHLAKLVAARLIEQELDPPSEKTLLRLFETLYFASLKTDEDRPCECTVNFLDPQTGLERTELHSPSNNWKAFHFRQPIPLSVRSLIKLSESSDPTVSSLAVFCDDNGELYVWGMVDQEVHCGDHVSGDKSSDPNRPGLFQASVIGVGNLAVYKDFRLLGSLEQNNLVTAYHDVLWQGPVHKRLKENLWSTLLDDPVASVRTAQLPDVAQVKEELLIRWQNAVCRMLLNIQRYGHGGGLLIVPSCPAESVGVKYQLHYDRLPRALFNLAQHQLLKKQAADNISKFCQSSTNLLPCDVHYDAIEYQEKAGEHKLEALGCVRFIAALSRVDGFVLLDKNLIVHGFGVETLSESDLTEIYIAGDAKASLRLLRQSALSHFGTRHRAMMRYCNDHAGALGFVISQDGDIRATMKVKDRLVLWENINVQIGLRREGGADALDNTQPMSRLFQYWTQSLVLKSSA